MSPPSYDRKDHFYRKAKEEGYRSRAAYKLLELQERFKLLKVGTKVLDLGSWPGGWLQVASNIVGNSGLVVGIDLVRLDNFPTTESIHTLVGDAKSEEAIQAAMSLAHGPFDVVLSDMAPKLTGISDADAAQAVQCAEIAEFVAEKTLTRGGTLVIKLFMDRESGAFVKRMKSVFNKAERVALESTRRGSSEYYFVGIGKKSGPAPAKL